MFHLIFFELLYVQTSVAWDDKNSIDVLGSYYDAQNFRISCEMDTILEFLMCAEDKVKFTGKEQRDFVMILGNSLSGKSSLAQYLGGAKLKSVLVTTEIEEYTVFERFVNSPRLYSLTVIPEQVFDRKTRTVFYDCPSYSNFQNFSSAVISSYLLKKVVDLAERVKIVLTVSYSSVTSGESEKDLLSLLTQTARFINNVTHFHQGIALMVTKVENRWLGNEALVDDFTVREEIEEFIIDFKTHWILEQVQDYPFDNKYMYEKVLNLTDILLSVYSVEGSEGAVKNDSIDEDEINRIGLFRRPNVAEKSLSEIPLLEETKHRVLATIHKAIDFTAITRDDFSCILGTDGIILAHDIKGMMNEVVTNKTFLVALLFAEYFEEGGKPYHIHKTSKFFTETYAIYRDMYMEIYNLTEINRLPDILSNTSNVLNMNIPREYFVDLKVNIDFMLFLERMAPDHLYVSVSEWIEPFWSIYESVRWSNIWYIFLNSLFKTLSSPEILNYKHLYDVKDIENWGNGSSEIGIQITEFNCGIFIEKLERYNIDRWDDIAEYTPTERQMNDLNIVVNVSFHGQKQVYCEEDTLKFSGLIVQVSMIKTENCTPNVVILFASQTIEIDDDIDYHNKRMSLVMIAPLITVRGYRTINLAGKDGEKKLGPIIDINFAGENGSDGIAGSPGNASGHFVAVCNEIIVSGKLSVLTYGGKGADGQKGGHGGIGILRTSKNKKTHLKSKDMMPDVTEYDACSVITKGNDSTSFKLMKCGSCGGSGGDGGKGGMSGPRGILKFITHNKGTKLLEMKDALRHGKDGTGGTRGKNGRTVEHIFTTNFPLTDDEMCGKALSKSCPVCKDTVDGKAGAANVEDSISHDTQVPLPKLDEILDLYHKQMGDLVQLNKVRETFGFKSK